MEMEAQRALDEKSSTSEYSSNDFTNARKAGALYAQRLHDGMRTPTRRGRPPKVWPTQTNSSLSASVREDMDEDEQVLFARKTSVKK